MENCGANAAPQQRTGFSQPPLNVHNKESNSFVFSLPACSFFSFSFRALDTGQQASRVHFATSEKDCNEMEPSKSIPSYNTENSPFWVTTKTWQAPLSLLGAGCPQTQKQISNRIINLRHLEWKPHS